MDVFLGFLAILIVHFSNFILCNSEKTCYSLTAVPSLKISCKDRNNNVIDCNNPGEGAKASVQCADFYEALSARSSMIAICRNGLWSNLEKISCKPICGRKHVPDPGLIIRGEDAKRGEYPWQVAIYNIHSKILLCGGSLINERTIVTAAHCVTDDRGNTLPKEDYVIAAGKYYRKYDDERDRSQTQISEVDSIHVTSTYRGTIDRYLADIAVLTIKKFFFLSETVQPVCLDVNNDFHYFEDISDQSASVSGWGYTKEDADLAENLKSLRVPIVTRDVCLRQIPEEFEEYLTRDKICAGFIDKGTSVCRGDSGGGLTMRYKQRYHLIGVLSSSPGSPRGSGCNSQEYALYTKISSNIDFVSKLEQSSRPVDTIFTRLNDVESTNSVPIPSLEECVYCICKSTSGCNQLKVDCSGGLCGRFRVSEAFWIDAGNITDGLSSTSGSDFFQKCMGNFACSKATLKAYFLKYRQDCNNDGKINCEDFALLHKHGRIDCKKSLEDTFLDKFNNCKELVI